MSRFDIDLFQSPPHDAFLCGICRDVLDNPLELKCRHMFCTVCINQLLKSSSKCPLCRTFFEKKHLEPVLPFVQDLINKLQMRCQFSFSGCKNVVAVEVYIKHVAGCGFRIVQCQIPGCDKPMLKKDRDRHQEQECLHRTFVCDKGCESEIKVGDMDSHNCISTLRRELNDARESIQKLKQEQESLLRFCCEALNLIEDQPPPPPPSISARRRFMRRLRRLGRST